MYQTQILQFQADKCLNKADELPIPNAVDLVNQTVSIPTEPVKEEYLQKVVLEYKQLSETEKKNFLDAIANHEAVRKTYREKEKALRVEDVRTDDHKDGQTAIWLRIIKERGIDFEALVNEDYNDAK